MNYVKEARILVDFIKTLESFYTFNVPKKQAYNHIGGLFTDIVLQAGLNYKNTVKPRVEKVINTYPEAYTVVSFYELIEKEGLPKIILWNHPIKLKRIYSIIEFCVIRKIDTCHDLQIFFSKIENHKQFLEIEGVGPKTLDYTLKLLSFDTVAVDRHIFNFVKKAGIIHDDYYSVKTIVEFAADIMNISRSSIDFSIWSYMSESGKQQLKLAF